MYPHITFQITVGSAVMAHWHITPVIIQLRMDKNLSNRYIIFLCFIRTVWQNLHLWFPYLMRQSFTISNKTLDWIDTFGLILHRISLGSPSCECIKELKIEKLQPLDVRRYIFASFEIFSGLKVWYSHNDLLFSLLISSFLEKKKKVNITSDF